MIRFLILFSFLLLDVNGMIRFNHPVIIEPRSNGPIVANLFNQTLDHFSTGQPQKYWNQRYWYNKEFVYAENHPVFLRVDGEKESDFGWLHGGQWNDWGRKVGAMMYVLEHRFYGKSRPTDDISTENLKYLSSSQALQDIKSFIEAMNLENNYTSANKWVLFGGSYSGNLVAWSRLHFPELVTGAVSSSAPVQAQLDFSQYRDPGVRFSLDYYSPGCADSVHQAMVKVQSLLDSGSNEDIQTFRTKFNCRYPDTKEDKVMFYLYLVDSISSYAQNNNQGSESQTLKFLCDNIFNNKAYGEPIDRLAAFKEAEGAGCPWRYKTSVKDLQHTDYRDNDDFRQWYYQTCNEFGYFQTSEKKSSIMSNTIPLSYYTQQCTDVFGPKYNANQLRKAIALTNAKNKGWNIQTTNIVFLQGNIDPWHLLGTIQHPSSKMPYILINGTSHTYDMIDRKADDSPSLVNARNVAFQNIVQWVYF